MKILFVCLGNICRSPMAECVLKTMVAKRGIENLSIDSVGLISYHTGESPDYRMQQAARKKGYIMNHHARKISDADFADFDLIIGMDSENISRLKRICPRTEYLKKIKLVADYFQGETGYDSVPDPYYGSERDFFKVIELLENACEGILESHN